MRNPKLVLVLKSGSHSENAIVGPLCNPWPIQLYFFLESHLLAFVKCGVVRNPIAAKRRGVPVPVSIGAGKRAHNQRGVVAPQPSQPGQTIGGTPLLCSELAS